MSRRESIFRVALLDDGKLECEDWRGNVTQCSEAELGKTVRQVLADPNLEPVERVSAGAYNYAEAVARRVLPEQYQRFAGPAASMFLQAIQRVVSASNEAAQRRAETWRQEQQKQPDPPPPPPQQPRQTAYRRGRRTA